MVWQERITHIVMLTNCEEGKRVSVWRPLAFRLFLCFLIFLCRLAFYFMSNVMHCSFNVAHYLK